MPAEPARQRDWLEKYCKQRDSAHGARHNLWVLGRGRDWQEGVAGQRILQSSDCGLKAHPESAARLQV